MGVTATVDVLPVTLMFCVPGGSSEPGLAASMHLIGVQPSVCPFSAR